MSLSVAPVRPELTLNMGNAAQASVHLHKSTVILIIPRTNPEKHCEFVVRSLFSTAL